jgi:hypothetical protein
MRPTVFMMTYSAPEDLSNICCELRPKGHSSHARPWTGHVSLPKGNAVSALNQLSTAPWRRIGQWRYNLNILDFITKWRWEARSHARPLYPRGERITDTHCTGGYVGPRPGLDAAVTNLIFITLTYIYFRVSHARWRFALREIKRSPPRWVVVTQYSKWPGFDLAVTTSENKLIIALVSDYGTDPIIVKQVIPVLN